MRYNSVINNVVANEWGLDIKLAYLFAWLYELPSWAESTTYKGDTYYFASKNKAIEELPLLTDKRDTMYRYYKAVESKGLVKVIKQEGKDFVCVTSKGKKWNEYKTLTHSDKNPTLGNPSESNSDFYPTYNNTSSIIDIYKGENSEFNEKTFLEMWSRARMHYDKKPTNISKLGLNERSDFEQLVKDYSLKDFEYAIAGMFFQDTLPNVRVRPTHFLKLEYFETYLDCWKNKTKLFTKQTKKNDNTGMI